MPGRGRRRRRRGHFLRTARFLEPTLCLLLHHGPSHGYTLLERLEEFGLGALDSCVVYRALRDMEEKGWVTSTWDTEQAQGPPRRVYRLTAQGDEVLGGWIQDLRQTRWQIDYLIDTYSQHMEEGEGEHH
jgi:PadR family transcriptional regulator PadR